MTAVATLGGPLSRDAEWQRTKKSLKACLQFNLARMHDPKATDAERDQAYENSLKALENIKRHALNGLQIIDMTLVSSDLIKRIKQLGDEADAETARIRQAKASIDQLTSLVNLLTKVLELWERIMQFPT